MERWIKFAEKIRENSTTVVIGFTGVAKHVISFTVAVEIKARNNRSFCAESFDLISDGRDLWVKQFGGVFPFSVEVDSTEIASEISIDDSIHIYHRENFQNVVIENPLAVL